VTLTTASYVSMVQTATHDNQSLILTVCCVTCVQAAWWSDGAEQSTGGVATVVSQSDAGTAILQPTSCPQHADVHVFVAGSLRIHLHKKKINNLQKWQAQYFCIVVFLLYLILQK